MDWQTDTPVLNVWLRAVDVFKNIFFAHFAYWLKTFCHVNRGECRNSCSYRFGYHCMAVWLACSSTKDSLIKTTPFFLYTSSLFSWFFLLGVVLQLASAEPRANTSAQKARNCHRIIFKLGRCIHLFHMLNLPLFMTVTRCNASLKQATDWTTTGDCNCHSKHSLQKSRWNCKLA